MAPADQQNRDDEWVEAYGGVGPFEPAVPAGKEDTATSGPRISWENTDAVWTIQHQWTDVTNEAGLAWVDRLIELATEGPIFGMKDEEVPRSARGMGAWDAPRGALAHWIDVKDHRIKNYQMVVPSTWNASPRDEKGIRGPYEQSLIGCPVPDTDNPLTS